MKAAFKQGRTVTLREVELGPLGPEEIRIKVLACGICGSDLHENPGGEEEERSFGHEIAGVVEELGSAVTRLEVGQPVALESSTPCGRCDNCRNAEQDLCTDIQAFWRQGTLGMAEEIITPEAVAIPCDYLPPEIAVLGEPLGVAIDMVKLADISMDSNVLLMGAGPIGLMALALAKRAGARRIFVSGGREARLRLARQFGADEIIDLGATPLEEHDFGCNIDRILVTSPPQTLPAAFRAAAKGAIISFIGIAAGEGAICTFNVNEFHFKRLQLRASYGLPALFTARALQYLREGVVEGPALVSHQFPLSEVQEAVRVAKEDPTAVKVVVRP